LSANLPQASFLPIDIGRPHAIDAIRATFKGDPYQEKLQVMERARRPLLDHRNLYAFLDRELSNLAP